MSVVRLLPIEAGAEPVELTVSLAFHALWSETIAHVEACDDDVHSAFLEASLDLIRSTLKLEN